MLDLLIRDAILVDGTGCPRQRTDIGVLAGRVVEVGKIVDSAKQIIAADGLIVAPGFIDLHTHYDPQVLWDPACTPSPFHGITTVFGGNCGFSLAPVDVASTDYVTRMLARVEGMSLATLEAGVTFNWSGFGGYLDALEGQLTVNAGFLVGHSTIRRLIMGDAATARAATSDEIALMCDVLRDSLSAGGLGFSSSRTEAHLDGAGDPVPSRLAAPEELLALSAIVREFPGTTLAFIPNLKTTEFLPETLDLVTRMSIAGDRPVNWNVLIPSMEHGAETWGRFELSDYAAARGGAVHPLVMPSATDVYHTFETAFVLASIPDWRTTMLLPTEEKIAALRDPATRRRLANGVDQLADGSGRRRDLFRWDTWEVVHSHQRGLEGRRVSDIAAERNLDLLDCIFDITIADQLETVFLGHRNNDDENWRFRTEVWSDPRAVVGGSDAGAHLDVLADFNYTTKMLAACRDLELLDLETAVHQLTEIPARLYGLRGRGRVEVGAQADLVMFDESTVDSEPARWHDDLPAGGGRLYAGAVGIHSVFVNGAEIVHGGELTGQQPGRLIRSGRDTDTVSVSAA